jgi:hypothetical protein
MSDGLPCLNCKKLTPESDAKVFAEVFVCSICYEMADRLFHRLEGELRRLLLLTKETIRVALVEGKLHFEHTQEREVPKDELLRMILQFSEKKDREADARRSGS